MPAADTPLRALRVMSPNGQGECAGIYVLVASEMPNGRPLWEQSASGGHWLFSGTNGRWCIGGQDVRRSNFTTAAAWLFSKYRHKGRMPQDVGGPWQRWNGSAYQEDDAIRITVATPSMPLPACCNSGTSVKPNRGKSAQPSVTQPPTLVSRVNSHSSYDNNGAHESLQPPPHPHPPPCAPSSPLPPGASADQGLLDLRGIRLDDRHRRVLQAASVGGQLRVCL